MTNNYDIFISHKSLPLANCHSCFCSNVVLALLTFLKFDYVQVSLHSTRLIEKFLRSSLGVLLVLLWLSYKILMWIHSAFEEGLKIYVEQKSLQVKAAEPGVMTNESNLVVSKSDVLEHIIRALLWQRKEP